MANLKSNRELRGWKYEHTRETINHAFVWSSCGVNKTSGITDMEKPIYDREQLNFSLVLLVIKKHVGTLFCHGTAMTKQRDSCETIYRKYSCV